ncbi:type VI secretion system baseplate subunit TssF [Pseudoduganella violaceinigra]|uniref:type VI secretion system baseplate subunit TssF n=1 Tax=Pseudoduganella violaceinigra TaxID=246602 RepID=UPI0004844632|nr:type VI secretion system baseplate subunit TssF [Pseudoduganella violaceinigra]
MEQILPALEGQLRRFRLNAAYLAALHPRLASQLGRNGRHADAHVDRLVQGVAMLHARTALTMQRARRQQDEHLLELHYPGQLPPFPECRIEAGDASVAVTTARYRPGPDAAIELELELDGVEPRRALDVFIDGEAAFSAALRSALLSADGHVALARPAIGGEWLELPRWPFAPTGLDPDEGLLPRPPGAHAGLALLREFFTFPARFNVIRLDLSSFAGAGRWALRLPIRGAKAAQSCLLQALHASHLRAGWTARACLQRIAAAPVILNGQQSEYLVSVPPELEIFSLDRVQVDGAAGSGWVARRVEGAVPGHEWRIAFRAECAWRVGAVASIETSCCRRNAVLGRAARGAGCRWQLNSLLALDHSPLGTAALRELMATQAISNAPASQAIIDAVQGLEVQPALLCPSGAAPLQGAGIRLHVDVAAFAGCGLLLFAQVMDRFFAECAHINTFTRLALVSATTGEELIRCKARNGGILLE